MSFGLQLLTPSLNFPPCMRSSDASPSKWPTHPAQLKFSCADEKFLIKVQSFLGSITNRCSVNDFTLQVFPIVHYFGVVLNSLIRLISARGKRKLDFGANDC